MRTKGWILGILAVIAMFFCCGGALAEETAEETAAEITTAAADEESAENSGVARNIAAECTYAWQKNAARNEGDLYNGNYSYYWESAKAKEAWLEVTLPEGETCSGVQIKWYAVYPDWSIEVEQDGQWVRAGGYTGDYLTTWTPLYRAKKFRIVNRSKIPIAMRIVELEVYSDGERPESVQVWEPTVEKADLLMVVAHPDDEYIFMGALIPYYGAEWGKRVLVCYITESEFCRRTELLDGLWTAGLRTYPLIGKFYDRYTMDLGTAYEKIGKKKVQEYMIEVFRHYKPEVVVTHDINGEYGHGVHKVCADIVINALKRSGDKSVCRQSAKDYGTWEVKKCYIHLYEKNQIRFDWEALKLEAFGGMSALEVADAAWQCHTSQALKGKYEVYVSGPYDSQVYGLYYTSVGKDTEMTGFFENIPEDSYLVDDEE